MIVDAYEKADKVGKFVPDPMKNEQYRDRSPVVKDDAPRQTDDLGLPVPRSWKDRRKVKLREFDEENFNGGNLNEAIFLLDNVSSQFVQADQAPMSCDQPKLFDRKLMNDDIKKVEDSRAITPVSRKHNTKTQRTNVKKNPDQISLFDVQNAENPL